MSGFVLKRSVCDDILRGVWHNKEESHTYSQCPKCLFHRGYMERAQEAGVEGWRGRRASADRDALKIKMEKELEILWGQPVEIQRNIRKKGRGGEGKDVRREKDTERTRKTKWMKWDTVSPRGQLLSLVPLLSLLSLTVIPPVAVSC